MSDVRLSQDEKVSIILLCGHLSTRAAADKFNADNPGRNVNQSTVSRLLQKFKTSGSVHDLHRSGRPSSVTNDGTATAVVGKLVISPKKSIRKLSQECGISRGSIHRILQKHKFHPYKVQLVQELHEDDADRRMEFCDWMLQQPISFIESVMFSDEAMFYLSAHVNRHNYRYWCDTNPHWMDDSNIQNSPRVMVWAAIWRNRLIGPFFFDENVTKDSYLSMLKNFLEPFLNELPLHERQQLWFQQDGAPPHFGLNVRNFLDTTFPRQWIGRRGAVEWPPRSPDLTPLDFFLWGHLKSVVFTTRPRTLDDLKSSITNEMAKIHTSVIQRTLESVLHRCRKCIEQNGGQFEHLL